MIRSLIRRISSVEMGLSCDCKGLSLILINLIAKFDPFVLFPGHSHEHRVDKKINLFITNLYSEGMNWREMNWRGMNWRGDELTGDELTKGWIDGDELTGDELTGDELTPIHSCYPAP